jgi:hypothetical protein
MSGNLIPQKRMDKTGKVVTRHVLAVAPASTPAVSIPSPAVKSPAKKKTAFKPPLPKQLQVKSQMTSLRDLRPDPEIFEVLRVNPEQVFPLVPVKASDVQLFDMFSVVSTSNAAMLMSSGVMTPGDAISLLESRGMKHLILDRREMMNKAQSSRVSAWSLMEATRKFDIDEMNCDSDLLIQAVRLDGSSTLPRWKIRNPDMSTSEDSYAHQVMNGSISYDDVMSLGLSFLSDRALLAPKICSYLNDIHMGRADYDVTLMQHVIMKCRDRASILDDVMEMAGEYGPDFVMELHAFDRPLEINREHRDRPTSQRAELIRYVRDGSLDFTVLTQEEAVRLFDNDVPVGMVKELLNADMNADQIISAHKEGISQPVASGWL